jgi:hypothetical protein
VFINAAGAARAHVGEFVIAGLRFHRSPKRSSLAGELRNPRSSAAERGLVTLGFILSSNRINPPEPAVHDLTPLFLFIFIAGSKLKKAKKKR